MFLLFFSYPFSVLFWDLSPGFDWATRCGCCLECGVYVVVQRLTEMRRAPSEAEVSKMMAFEWDLAGNGGIGMNGNGFMNGFEWDLKKHKQR